MADNDSSTNPAPVKIGSAKPEISMEKRLLMAFGLMGLVLLGSQYLFPTPEAPKTPPPAAVESAAEKTPEAAPDAPKPEPVPAAATPIAGERGDDAERTFTIETENYRVTFSNRGATVRSWILKNYDDNNGKPVEVVSAAAAPTAGWPFQYVFRASKPETDLNKVYFAAEQPDPHTIIFEYAKGPVSARKVFRFDEKMYRAELESEVIDHARTIPHLLAWRGGFGDLTAHNAAGTMKSVVYDIAKNKLIEEDAGVAKEGPVTLSGSFSFAGLQDTYFAAVLLPEAGESLDFQTWQDKFAPAVGEDDIAHVGAAWGTQGALRQTLFVGPKDTAILRDTNPKLQQLIDWGWFWFIAKPLFSVLLWFDANWTHNWGWAIVVVTIIINILMLPLRISSLRSARKMSSIQPQIAAINEKYKGISMKDPRKQEQNAELMALYQKSGINPLGGCIPLLLQMPFFIAFFKVLSVAIELRGASWLWVPDLSQPEQSFIRLLPIGMLITQVGIQKMTPTPSADPSQQKIMMLMPIMLGVMFYGASSGLVLYWLTGNVVGIVQQYFFNKTHPIAAPAPVQTTAQSKKKKK
ncbi:MAG: membrane protein insertase YidC [Bryobacteraceae bacterium]|nr:membrane protein insertase YidC [Bryobacteraceae bacterium]